MSVENVMCWTAFHSSGDVSVDENGIYQIIQSSAFKHTHNCWLLSLSICFPTLR